MSIISPSNFIGEINIPNLDSPGISSNLNGFINKYEPKYLKLVLGNKFADDFAAGLLVDPIEQRWTDLKNLPELKEAIADYVYCFWIKNQVTMTTGTGEVKTKNENSTIVNPTQKMVRAWNEMVKDNIAVCEWLNEKSDVYPTWPKTGMETYNWEGTLFGFNSIRCEMFHYKNGLGI